MLSIHSQILSVLCGLSVAAPLFAATDPENPTRELPVGEYPQVVSRFIQAKDFEKATQLIEEGLKANPLSVQLRFQRCVVFEKSEQTTEAIACLRSFIGRYPEICEPHNNLGAIYYRQGDILKAEELFAEAIRLRPNYAPAHENLARVYLAKAKQSFKAAQKNGKKGLDSSIQTIDSLISTREQ